MQSRAQKGASCFDVVFLDNMSMAPPPLGLSQTATRRSPSKTESPVTEGLNQQRLSMVQVKISHDEQGGIISIHAKICNAKRNFSMQFSRAHITHTHAETHMKQIATAQLPIP